MERKEVLVSAEELARQKEFMRKVRAIHETRTRAPLALVDTFGCQQNVADGEMLMGMLREMGCELTTDENQADIILLNTCAIREHAEKRVYGHLGQLTHTKAANPDQIICLCGCMAQQKRVADKVKESHRHVDLVLGPQAEWRLPELLYQVYTKRSRVFSIADEHGRIAEGLPVVREGGVRAWVSIMYGCNNFCSYCIVPYVRGRERSRDPEKIIAECRELIEAGYREITLLGQNVNSYGNDLDIDYDFADLLSAIDAIPGDYWLRFMSSQPKDATPKLFDTMARCAHVAKNLHLPVQSGNDRVLRAMHRPYTRAGYLELIGYARRVMPNLVLTSDVIIGFPGERRKRRWIRSRWCERRSSTRCSPSSSPRAPARPRPPCPTLCPARKSSAGLTGCWTCRTPTARKNTRPTWAKPSACWWTERATTKTIPSPAARRATASCARRATRR